MQEIGVRWISYPNFFENRHLPHLQKRSSRWQNWQKIFSCAISPLQISHWPLSSMKFICGAIHLRDISFTPERTSANALNRQELKSRLVFYFQDYSISTSIYRKALTSLLQTNNEASQFLLSQYAQPQVFAP